MRRDDLSTRDFLMSREISASPRGSASPVCLSLKPREATNPNRQLAVGRRNRMNHFGSKRSLARPETAEKPSHDLTP